MEAEHEHINPFASPLAEDSAAGPGVPSDIAPIEAIRRQHLSREASIKSLGVIAYIGAILGTFVLLSLVSLAVGAIQGDGSFSEIAGGSLFTLLFVALVVLSWWVATGLRRLNPAVRPWTMVLGVLWFLVSLGTVNVILIAVSIYSIWLVAGEKAKYIFSPEYKDIMAATPHIRYKTSIVVWVLLGLVLLLLLLGVIATVRSSI